MKKRFLIADELAGLPFLLFDNLLLVSEIGCHNEWGKEFKNYVAFKQTDEAGNSFRVRTKLPYRLQTMTMRSALHLSCLCLLLVGCTAAAMQVPIHDIGIRPTLLTFGMYVTPDPANNPISPPERFIGYHVGTDFEVTKEELDVNVPVFAICSGKVVMSGFVEGYGGLIVHRCKINGESVTVLYGHLFLSSLPKNGTSVVAGKQIALLGPARSHDTDGNRKHLHLGIHRGTGIDVRGYVQTKEEISEYIDPLLVLPKGGALQNLELNMVSYWKTETGFVVHP